MKIRDAGQTIYTIIANDDVAVTSYAIAGTDPSLLSVNSSTGVVSLTADPDYETKNSYSFTVTASDAAGNTSDPTTVTFSINDLDDTIPVITLTGSDVSQEVGGSYTDAGATALDNIDGDITSNIATVNPVDPSTVGVYTVTYNVSDAAGNPAVEVTRTVNLVDTTAPIITVIGDNPTYIEKEAIYTDAGATSDGIEEVSSSVLVNTNIVGSYTVNYSATDTSGNTGTATRTVIVEDTTAPIISGLDAYQVSENISNLNIATFTSELETEWSIAGVDATLFTINQEGELSFNTTPDFENPLDNDQNNTYIIEIFATDSYENTSELSVDSYCDRRR